MQQSVTNLCDCSVCLKLSATTAAVPEKHITTYLDLVEAYCRNQEPEADGRAGWAQVLAFEPPSPVQWKQSP